MENRKDNFISTLFSVVGIIVMIVGFALISSAITGCKSTISTQQYQAEFEKAAPL